MESYTFNSSKSKRFRGKFLILYNKYLMMWSGIFIYLAKAYRNRSKKAFNSGRSLVEESEGISFRIQKAILMDRNVMRLLIITTDPNSKAEKKKYFCYVFGDYQKKFVENKGVELEVEDSYLYVARDLHESWKVI